MTVEHPRSDWTSTTSGGCAAMPTSGVTAVVYHWPGSEGSLVGKNVPSLLRGWRDYHVNQRGWCDIAYQWAVDLKGEVWELRGYNRRSAAQDAPAVPGSENDTMYAVLCVLGQADTPTAAMVDGMRYLRGKALVRTPAATGTLGHRDVSGDTECPGAKLLDIIHSGAVKEAAVPLTPEEIQAIADAVWNRRVQNPSTGNYRDADEYLAAAGNAAYAAQQGVAQLLARPAADVDEVALADALAPLLETRLSRLSDEDIQRIATAANDELARRVVS